MSPIGIEADVTGTGRTAGRDEDFLGGDRSAVRGLDEDDAAFVPGDAGGFRIEHDVDTLVAEGFRDQSHRRTVPCR